MTGVGAVVEDYLAMRHGLGFRMKRQALLAAVLRDPAGPVRAPRPDRARDLGAVGGADLGVRSAQPGPSVVLGPGVPALPVSGGISAPGRR